MTTPDTLTIGGVRYQRVRQTPRAHHACDGCAAQQTNSRYNDRLCAEINGECLLTHIYVRKERGKDET